MKRLLARSRHAQRGRGTGAVATFAGAYAKGGDMQCHTRFHKVNRMQTMYVPGSETHVHNDYIFGHHHTLLKVNSGKVL